MCIYLWTEVITRWTWTTGPNRTTEAIDRDGKKRNRRREKFISCVGKETDAAVTACAILTRGGTSSSWRRSGRRSPSVGYALDELLNDFVPCDEMRHLLVPATPAPNPPCPLLFAQVTRLRCGGVVLGLALHHSVVDARSAAHFVETWASIARGGGGGGGGGDAPLPPCFDHRLLSARPPATRAVLYDHPEYKPEPAPEHAVAAGSAYASAIITLSKSQVSALKARCAGASTFRAVVALVWQCACRARALPADASAPGRRRDAALLHGGHARAPGAAAVARLLRERGDPDVGAGHGRGGGGEPRGLRGTRRERLADRRLPVAAHADALAAVAAIDAPSLAPAQALLLFLTNERAVWSFSQPGPTRQSTQTVKNKQKGNGMTHRAKEITDVAPVRSDGLVAGLAASGMGESSGIGSSHDATSATATARRRTPGRWRRIARPGAATRPPSQPHPRLIVATVGSKEWLEARERGKQQMLKQAEELENMADDVPGLSEEDLAAWRAYKAKFSGYMRWMATDEVTIRPTPPPSDTQN
ncbi:hypothetical protein BDA96_06G156900 [Sorghum bicolor]|uniref:Uncharacterized protein n=1 Tax=Sorghum bicolor TaxID=4558 RepID=A0A921UC33_SORBI|nr:hypothetical protein BDA96_06G156900 [Sorghum bicolor]